MAGHAPACACCLPTQTTGILRTQAAAWHSGERQSPVGGTVRHPSRVRSQRCRMICIHAAGSHEVRAEQQQLGRSLVMWSRVRRAGFVMALALPCSLSAVQSAYAGLGGAPMTPPTDASVSSHTVQPGTSSATAAQSVMRSASSAASSTSASASYTVRETTLGNGTVVREYLAADGSVFGIAWHGPQMPDLNDLLGSYFSQ